MNQKIQGLLEQIETLEQQLCEAVHEHETQIMVQMKATQAHFEESIQKTHQSLKTGFWQWVIRYRPQNLLTGPVIYSMIIPLLILDLFVSVYQALCFPVYGICKVLRTDFIVFDRHHLAYLNWIEKFHCSYCAYASGLLAYVSEIVGRTEEYFCPIKHARKQLSSHAHYQKFLAFGEAEEYEKKLEKIRVAMNQKAP